MVRDPRPWIAIELAEEDLKVERAKVVKLEALLAELSANLKESDRNARAYGWEIGRGRLLGKMIETSPDNPFLNQDWMAPFNEDELSSGYQLDGRGDSLDTGEGDA